MRRPTARPVGQKKPTIVHAPDTIELAERAQSLRVLVEHLYSKGYGVQKIVEDLEDLPQAQHVLNKVNGDLFDIVSEIYLQRAEQVAYAEAERRSGQCPAEIISSNEFVSNFEAPEYLLDGVLQMRFCYALTAKTGGGKTAIALLLAYCVSQNRSFDGRKVLKGRVLYDDVRMRWLAMGEKLKFDPAKANVHWLVGTKISLAADYLRIREKIKELGGVDLVIVDTGPAYFEGVDENANREMGDHARCLRELTTLEGGPCVLVLCHPVKNATDNNLLPRGGGAFLNEIDGNIGMTNDDGFARMFFDREVCGKFRGAEFEPFAFQLEKVTAQVLRDKNGMLLPTVIAKVIGEERMERMRKETEDEGMRVLRTLNDRPRATVAEIANFNHWRSKDGKQPLKSKVHRILKMLVHEKYLTKTLNGWHLTPKARKLLDGQS
jgi:hypothetical protein